MPEQAGCTGTCSGEKLPVSRAEQKSELIQALDAHAGLIIASAARVLGNLADAEDVAQDVAETLLRSRIPRIRNWPAYLRTLAVNKAVDQLRRRKDRSDFEIQQLGRDPEAALYDQQRADVLRRAVSRLSQRDGRIFSLYYFGDLSHGDVAAQMNMTANAVGVALHRIRARLKDEVGASLDSAEGANAK